MLYHVGMDEAYHHRQQCYSLHPSLAELKSPITVHGSAEAEAVGHSAVADTVAAAASVPLVVALWLHTSDTKNLENSYYKRPAWKHAQDSAWDTPGQHSAAQMDDAQMDGA